MRKLLVAAAALAALLVAAALVLLFVDFDAPGLGREVLGRLGARAGIELSAREFRLNLMRGLELEGVEAAGELPAGRFSAGLERLVLEHRLLPLLGGRVVVDRLVLVRPEIEMVSAEPASAAPPPPAPAGGRSGTDAPAEGAGAAKGGLELAVSRVVLSEGTLLVHSGDGPEGETEVRGLAVALGDLTFDPGAPSALIGLAAAGTIAAEQVRLGTVLAEEAGGRLRVRDGHLLLEALAFRTAQGRFRIEEMDVDLTREPLAYRLALAGDPLDLDSVLGAAEGGEFGPARLDLSAAGEGPEAAGLAGEGSVHLAAGTLPSTPVLAGLERLLGAPRVVGARYEAAVIPFRVARSRLELDRFELVSEEVKLSGAGWVDLDGPLSLRLQLRTPRQGVDIEEIPRELLDALTGEDGWLAVPVLVTGTQEAPRLVPDPQALRRAAREGAEDALRKKLEEEVGRGLKKLFGGKRKDG